MPTQTKQLALIARDHLRITAEGRIVDFLNPEMLRQNTPEERVRQGYARKLHHEYGYPLDLMAMGVPIQMGSETRFADIVIYHTPTAATRRDQGQIHLVVETKAPDRKTGQAQLKSYISASSAEGGAWINESDAPLYLHRVGSRIEEWPNLPHASEEWESIGKHKKHQLRPPHDLVETFKRCHNALYKVGIDSDDLAMDMVRIILAKYRDELKPGDTCEFRCTASELQSSDGRKKVADRVRSLFEQVRDDNLSIFEEHENISAGDRETATVVSELQDFRFVADDESDDIYDVVGAAYEVYVGSHLKGDRGQYFTHRLMVQLLVKLVDPSESDVILDPAMGSGGFLIAAMRHVTHKIMHSARTAAAKRKTVQVFRNHIYGIDKSQKLVKVARTNMVLASDGHSGLVKGDSLEPRSRLPREFRPKTTPPSVILTNPPFGATNEHRITADRDPEILEQFELGHAWRRSSGELRPTSELSGEGVPPEYLFIERCVQWVQPGGRIGIVVPRGILDNDKALPVRLLLLRETRVLAVVNCHDDTFKPYTDAKAALLVLEKKRTQSTREDDYSIFMAISQAIGHNGIGEPIYKTDNKGDQIIVDGRQVIDQDADEIYTAWNALHSGVKSQSESYFQIPRKGLLPDNLNLNPVRYLPRYSASRQSALLLGEREGWTATRLGDIAKVYNGPRFKRPYAEKGVTCGPGILRYFTGNAITQTRGENIKYLDLNRAKPVQVRMIEKLYLRRGMLLITDAGTVGRVVYATAYHEGAVGTNNLIRVETDDIALRGYLYQYLLSSLGQHQLKANIYGGIVDHLEPDDVKNLIVPLPQDRSLLESIGLQVISAIEHQEAAHQEMAGAAERLSEYVHEDADDISVATVRIREIETQTDAVIRGGSLEAKMKHWMQ